ncbi:MAG: glycosyltransferase family 39 protein [Chloroflexi bacterium]|nr:glycosyltransferase family 39 protein [Chloroflexota bacterium]
MKSIIIVAVLLRVIVAVYLGNTIEELPGIADELSYHTLALRVLHGHGFSFGKPWWPATAANAPTAHWSYLYTLWLTAVYAISGANPIVARLIQAVAAGILMPWFIYRFAIYMIPSASSIATKQTFLLGQKVGIVGAAIMAVYIYFVYYAASLITETFYIIAIMWAFDLTFKIIKSDAKMSDWILLGVALGTAVLLRQLFLLFIPFLLLWLWWAKRPKLRYLVLQVGIVLGMMLPFTIRNYYAFDKIVPLNTNSGYAFFWGNHPIYGTKFVPILTPEMGTYQSLIPQELLDIHLNEAELDSALLGRGLDFVFDDPGRYVLLSLSRIPTYFNFLPSSQSSLVSNISRVASFGLFFPFMLAGLWYSLRQKRPSWQAWLASPFTLIYLFMLFYSSIHILTWTLIRYRIPVDTFLIIFAAWALVLLAEWLLVRRKSNARK